MVELREQIAGIISPSSWLTNRAARPDQGDVKRADRKEARFRSLAKADAIIALLDTRAQDHAPISSMGEVGWLIESWNSRTGQFLATWWAGQADEAGWTANSVEAMRFSRERDAQAYIDETGWTEAKPTEHRWSSPLPTSSELDALRGRVQSMRDCNICGGKVDLSNPVKPTAHVGPGGNPKTPLPPPLEGA